MSLRIAIVIGSTRPARRTEVAARWVAQLAEKHPAVAAGDVTVESVDLTEMDLPLLDEPRAAIFGEYSKPYTRAWAEAIASYDGFIFVTPEYNHSLPAALKNAIDFLYAEWNDKAAGFVSHGIHGGTRAVEHLRVILAEVKVATVRSQVALSTLVDFELSGPGDPGICTPGPRQETALNTMLDELISWAGALRSVRR
jgi:NAD(P)H-dependent FMN reductase